MRDESLVSVIIPTKNSSYTLEGCLKSVKVQTYPYIELIVVDNNSSDNTKEIARRFTDKVFDKGPERTAQLNFGVEVAEGVYVLTIASDTEINKDLVNEAVITSREKECDGIILPEKQIGIGFWAKCKALERECLLGDDTIETPWFMKRKVYLDLGGYDEKLVACEDWDLNERFRDGGYKAMRIKSFMYHQIGHLSLIKMLKKKYYYGKTMLNYIKKRPGDYKNKIPIFRAAYYKSWRLLISHPLLALGFVVLKFLETSFASLGLLIGYLKVKKLI